MFKNIHMNNHYWINRIARTTFDIYLLHDNELIKGISGIKIGSVK